ncbi:diguanylate cyclase/phosphodiesterase domain 2 [Vibrio sinaloensis DSM 21326]|uniref:Diguanylate cyclase/phosphodiesterase domain 2 n=1 Tax=Vibrio sinaloensis DSM 21326 TaxID=945550 RepID=E8M2Q4_PHOS4|nr:EAL domain-containing protein [Vibrio sinaloensis]EGA71562.1 diguanylate cyclase/phosphodiesterase domain 2 [Vibrio sinaloensis DSM 21326]
MQTDTANDQTKQCSQIKNVPSDLNQLRSVIDQRTTVTFAQPIIELTNLGSIGFEALARGPLDSPLHTADKLFGAANYHNCLADLEIACLCAHLENIQRYSDTTLFSVNLSPNMLFDPQIHQALSQFTTPHRIKLELTEHLPVEDWAPVKQQMDRYRQMGYQFWLDDVGCGFFDLQLVDTVRPEVVKLCITLMDRLESGEAFLTELRSVIAKVHSYGGEVLAEGIETEQQLTKVRAMGVDLAQGYYFAKPSLLK